MADEGTTPEGGDGSTPLTAGAQPVEGDAAAKAAAEAKAATDKVSVNKAAADKMAAEAAAKAAADKKAVEAGQTPEQKKAAEEKAAADKKAADEKAKGAPEKYAAFTLPEGVKANDAELAKFHEVAKGLNLSQEQAQKLVDFETGRVKDFAEQHVKAWGEVTEGWLKEAKADKEYGGAKYDESVEIALRSVAKYGTPGLKKLYDDLGIGRHPEVIRYHYRVGKTVISEAEIVQGKGGPAGGNKTLAQRVFPSARN